MTMTQKRRRLLEIYATVELLEDLIRDTDPVRDDEVRPNAAYATEDARRAIKRALARMATEDADTMDEIADSLREGLETLDEDWDKLEG